TPDALSEAISRTPDDGALVVRLVELPEETTGAASLDEWRKAVGLELKIEPPLENFGDWFVLPSASGVALDELALMLRPIFMVDSPTRCLVAWHQAEPWTGRDEAFRLDWRKADFSARLGLVMHPQWSIEIEAYMYQQVVAQAANETCQHVS